MLRGEVAGAVQLLAGAKSASNDKEDPSKHHLAIPKEGIEPSKLMAVLSELHAPENQAETGRAFAFTYTTESEMPDLSKCLSHAYTLFSESGDSGVETHEVVLKKAWDMYKHTNALNPMTYPSLRRMENEIISMTAWMLHGDAQVTGSLTSGGTESCMMAVKAYRDLAKRIRGVTNPNMVCANSVHPAFEKAAHYFNVEIRHVSVGSDFRMDVAAARSRMDSNTILLVGSAPQYCHGVIDPIEALGKLAVEKGVPLHVDSCL